MAYHFDISEFQERRKIICAKMQEKNLDALLLFKQESMYYLTGYDTFGFVYFQTLYLSQTGDIFLLTRSADQRQAELTSIIDNIYIWKDGANADPIKQLKEILQRKSCANYHIGVEYEAYGLNAALGKKLDNTLNGFCYLYDASYLISDIRLIKSPAELFYIRQAATLADNALTATLSIIKAGSNEGDILATMQGEVFKGGGDYSGNPFIIGCGDHALLCRTKTGRNTLQQNDQVTLEWAGVYRMYHAAMMRTYVIGNADDKHHYYFEAAISALSACESVLKPNHTMGDVFNQHAMVLDSYNLQNHRLNACGYAMGALFQPNWMDYPMFYENNPTILLPGMSFFLHMIIMDSDHKIAMCLGLSYIITEKNHECLSKLPLEYIIS